MTVLRNESRTFLKELIKDIPLDDSFYESQKGINPLKDKTELKTFYRNDLCPTELTIRKKPNKTNELLL